MAVRSQQKSGSAEAARVPQGISAVLFAIITTACSHAALRECGGLQSRLLLRPRPRASGIQGAAKSTRLAPLRPAPTSATRLAKSLREHIWQPSGSLSIDNARQLRHGLESRDGSVCPHPRDAATQAEHDRRAPRPNENGFGFSAARTLHIVILVRAMAAHVELIN